MILRPIIREKKISTYKEIDFICLMSNLEGKNILETREAWLI